jgi:hypothetical protein
MVVWRIKIKNNKSMKSVISFLLLFISFGIAKAQTEKSKMDINKILSVYELQASPYLDKMVQDIKHPSDWSAEQIRNTNVAIRMSQKVTIEAINKETIDKYGSQKIEVANVKSYLDNRYRTDLKNLPRDFFEKVSNELMKG